MSSCLNPMIVPAPREARLELNAFINEELRPRFNIYEIYGKLESPEARKAVQESVRRFGRRNLGTDFENLHLDQVDCIMRGALEVISYGV